MMDKMSTYTSVPLDDESGGIGLGVRRTGSVWWMVKSGFLLALPAVVFFVFGLAMGRVWERGDSSSSLEVEEGRLLKQQEFVGEIPTKEVMFRFPTEYEDTGVDGDELWKELMPLGAGFIRVPHPRRFDMPASEPIETDDEEAETYSLSITHQLHCLAVIRNVIIKYEKGDKSRFAGAGHEYHCLDYIRQAILCAGDTTLDYADDRIIADDGTVLRYGFTGNNSIHQCRDWEAIKAFAVENRSGDKIGTL